MARRKSRKKVRKTRKTRRTSKGRKKTRKTTARKTRKRVVKRMTAKCKTVAQKVKTMTFAELKKTKGLVDNALAGHSQSLGVHKRRKAVDHEVSEVY